jgi:hypothetical protein
VSTGEVVRALSAERLGPYLAATGDVNSGIRLYDWNLAVSAAFYEVLSHFKVAVRNGLHDQLCQLTQRPDWWMSPGLVFAPEAAEMIAHAVHQARRRVGRQPGHVVAALPFGFWVTILSAGGSAAYETRRWRPALHRAFSNYRGPRRPLHRRLEHMRLFRNRIAHHEPIHYRHLAADHATILPVLEWISADFADWVAARSRVPALLAGKPTR